MYAKGEARLGNRKRDGNRRWICSCGDHIQMNFTACHGGGPAEACVLFKAHFRLR